MEPELIFIAVLLGILTLLFVYKKYIIVAVLCPITTRIDGKTVVITGGNRGVGKETARELSKRGARIILACRDVEKGKEAAQEISASTGNERINVKALDLASIKSIKEFVAHIEENEGKLDILINNAGIGGICQSKTEDGFEMTMGVNHLGHFLLTNLLLEKMRMSRPSRIINVAAHAHVFSRIALEDLMSENNYGSIKAYCQSKLANILFTRELANRLDIEETGVTSYSLHPGVASTGLGRHFKLANTFIGQFLMRHFMKTPEEGAQTTVYCAVAEDLEYESGWYYSNCAISTPTTEAFNDALAYKLWEISAKLVGLESTVQRVPIETHGDDDDILDVTRTNGVRRLVDYEHLLNQQEDTEDSELDDYNSHPDFID